jgi:hypothetical protein
MGKKAKARTRAQADAAATQARDSYVNLAANLGVTAPNLSNWSTYDFNPITRERMLLDWMYRGSWVVGLAQVGPDQVGFAQVGAVQFGAGQVSAGHFRLCQTDFVRSGPRLKLLKLAGLVRLSARIGSGCLGRFSTVKYDEEENKIFEATFWISITAICFGIIGAILIWLWANAISAQSPAPSSLGVFAADALAAAAAAGAGAVFGFIFAIPRLVEPESSAGAAATTRAAGYPLKPNTNLERISDWLTTLLIGATLVQVKAIAEWIGQLGNKLATGSATNESTIPIIVICYFALSFLAVYLIARLYLTYALELMQRKFLNQATQIQAPRGSGEGQKPNEATVGSSTNLPDHGAAARVKPGEGHEGAVESSTNPADPSK